jgi:pyruvate/2-oxoglutarate/acetoin dehydrogenase E1 component
MIPLIQRAVAETEASVEVVDLRCISPMDTETVVSSVNRTGRAVVVHEAPRSFGPGAEIAARIYEGAILSLEAPVERVTAPDITVPLPKGEDHYYVNQRMIVEGIERTLRF